MIYRLIVKEFTLELRRKSVISGIALYLISLVFICYLSFSLRLSVISEAIWSALFWLAILFSVINSVAKSFIGEKRGLSLYYYTIASPKAIIISKIIYNSLLCFILSLLGYVLFQVFISDPVQDTPLFFLTLILTSTAFSSALSLISGIASKTNHSNILMAVLSFPIIISILLMAIKVTKNVLDGLDWSASYDELLNLMAINCILSGLAYLLFPYIWRS
ncbi:heme exporter protein CcmB [Chryseosolibacter indicus]|uniref:Heme exporter protein CcmB n=1 Tax=Chryseosolibacter indicus TaxID=2782351 RepID=A0ABS5VUT7_9BACT|nr:heme exporter protein CcmB [Chryseosolibacter indicus]MBT1704585.1 heme exporter protein CcmB [Chryseosolibacter indicus]